MNMKPTEKREPAKTDHIPVLSDTKMDPVQGARSLHPKISQASNEFDWLSEKITIEFYNIEQPGCEQFFCYGDTSNPKSFTLQHGQIYELTRADVRFIETRQIPQYAYKPDGSGKMRKERIGYSPRFQCRPVWNRKPS